MNLCTNPALKESWEASSMVCAEVKKVTFVEKPSPISAAKAVKNTAELEGMREAHLRDSVALATTLHWLEEEVRHIGCTLNIPCLWADYTQMCRWNYCLFPSLCFKSSHCLSISFFHFPSLLRLFFHLREALEWTSWLDQCLGFEDFQDHISRIIDLRVKHLQLLTC